MCIPERYTDTIITMKRNGVLSWRQIGNYNINMFNPTAIIHSVGYLFPFGESHASADKNKGAMKCTFPHNESISSVVIFLQKLNKALKWFSWKLSRRQRQRSTTVASKKTVIPDFQSCALH